MPWDGPKIILAIGHSARRDAALGDFARSVLSHKNYELRDELRDELRITGLRDYGGMISIAEIARGLQGGWSNWGFDMASPKPKLPRVSSMRLIE